MVQKPTYDAAALTREITTALDTHKAALLAQLKTQLAACPAAAANWADATPETTTVTLHPTQGWSKCVYVVQHGDHELILSVFSPHGIDSERASFTDQKKLQDHYRANGLPVPQQYGGPFTVCGMKYPCLLNAFCHGYQLGPQHPITAAAAESLGHCVARSHKLAAGFHPHDARHDWKMHSLPHGFVHGDINFRNVILDPTTDGVVGILDFERVRYRPFADDLADRLRQFIRVTVTDGRFSLCMLPEAADFMRSYEAIRPLQPKEWKALETRVLMHAERKCTEPDWDMLQDDHPGSAIRPESLTETQRRQLHEAAGSAVHTFFAAYQPRGNFQQRTQPAHSEAAYMA